MKKALFVLFLLGAMFQGSAQNIQLHYDFGKFQAEGAGDRNYLTSTIEMFKPHSWGSTFFFVDFDFSAEDGKGIMFDYFEIAQTFKIPGVKYVELQLEYNDGMLINNPAYLTGVSVPFKKGPFYLTAKLLARKETFSRSLDGQFTFVWEGSVLSDKLSIRGFADFWTKDELVDGKQFAMLMEPQIWYNFNKHIAIGGELELSYNAYYFTEDSFEAMPTLGAKWNF